MTKIVQLKIKLCIAYLVSLFLDLGERRRSNDFTLHKKDKLFDLARKLLKSHKSGLGNKHFSDIQRYSLVRISFVILLFSKSCGCSFYLDFELALAFVRLIVSKYSTIFRDLNLYFLIKINTYLYKNFYFFLIFYLHRKKAIDCIDSLLMLKKKD